MAEPTAPGATDLAGPASPELTSMPRTAPTWAERLRLWLERLDDALFGPPHTFQDVLALVIIRLEADLPLEEHANRSNG